MPLSSLRRCVDAVGARLAGERVHVCRRSGAVMGCLAHVPSPYRAALPPRAPGARAQDARRWPAGGRGHAAGPRVPGGGRGAGHQGKLWGMACCLRGLVGVGARLASGVDLKGTPWARTHRKDARIAGPLAGKTTLSNLDTLSNHNPTWGPLKRELHEARKASARRDNPLVQLSPSPSP